MAGHGGAVLILPAEGTGDISVWLEGVLADCGYTSEVVKHSAELSSLASTSNPSFSVLIADYDWNGQDGAQTIVDLRSAYPDVPLIVIGQALSSRQVVHAVKQGALDCLPKPVDREDFIDALNAAVDDRSRSAPSFDAKPAAPWSRDIFAKNIFYGSHPSMRELESLVSRISWSGASLLIEGETGVGKEVLARELHLRSPRAQKRFLKLNCAALPSELVESELFGYERGAFTGAFQKKLGMFELADQGTIFLDEIGDMDFRLQAKLLQVLQDHEFQRLGGKETVRVDVRVIAATHCDLEQAILQKKFREDLYYRLNVISLKVPPLRERKQDLFEIAGFLIRKHQAAGTQAPVMNETLKKVMLDYDWPGNIRELENVVRKFLVLENADLVARDLRDKMERTPVLSRDRTETLDAAEPKEKSTILGQVSRAKDQAESTAILTALNSTNWNRKKAAFLLKIEYKALLYKMRKLSIDDKMAVLPIGAEASRSKVASAATL